jgi:hypothetical protein
VENTPYIDENHDGAFAICQRSEDQRTLFVVKED